MAAFVELWHEKHEIVDALFEAAREAERCRLREYNAAVVIQSWFRGCQVRAYLQYLREKAIIIQKTFRGYLGRKRFKQYAKEHFETMQKNYYDSMATRIQKVWRGYYSRTYIHSYYTLKEYLNSLEKNNIVSRYQLRKHQEQCEAELLAKEEEQQKLKEKEDAAKYHFMLSTQSCAGVFNTPKYGPLPFEHKMREMKFAKQLLCERKGRMRSKLDKQKETAERIASFSSTLGGTSLPVAIDLTAGTGDCRLRRSLPPITKPQGPFRDPEVAWQRRNAPLRPTLRVATSIDTLERARKELKAREQCNIVVEEKFVPFSRRHIRYEPLMHTASSFQRPAYGWKHFREEFPHKNITTQRLQTLVPSIPLFDEINLYSS